MSAKSKSLVEIQRLQEVWWSTFRPMSRRHVCPMLNLKERFHTPCSCAHQGIILLDSVALHLLVPDWGVVREPVWLESQFVTYVRYRAGPVICGTPNPIGPGFFWRTCYNV